MLVEVNDIGMHSGQPRAHGPKVDLPRVPAGGLPHAARRGPHGGLHAHVHADRHRERAEAGGALPRALPRRTH